MRVLYMGLSYYNNFYLSRALRKRGWVADVLSNAAEGAADPYSHGYDILMDYVDWDYRRARIRTALVGAILRRYARELAKSGSAGVAGRMEAWVLKRLITRYLKYAGYASRHKLTRLRAAVHDYDIFHFTGAHNLHFFYYFNPHLFGGEPIEWDILLLKRLGKKIVYSNNGCLDGVTQSSFRTWGSEPVCDICVWRDVPSVCSDERNDAWGRVRNRWADYQITCGGNRKDYNDDPRVHEVPQYYCLDPQIWNPDLMIPANYRLPFAPSTIKIYHAVANFESRTAAGSQRNIKSTHIYLPLIDKLKEEGCDVELIFFHDVPNIKLRYYQAQADIVVDMLTFGFFGATIREALMLGKPAICYLRPEWLASIAEEIPDFVAEMPVVSATPDTVEAVLRDLIQHPEKRAELGQRGRAFALKWFSAEAGADRLSEIYTGLLRN